MNQKEFFVRSYPKSELAMLYFPDATPHVALNRLNAWIRRCEELSDGGAEPPERMDPPLRRARRGTRLRRFLDSFIVADAAIWNIFSTFALEKNLRPHSTGICIVKSY